jgi:hypothetical protein
MNSLANSGEIAGAGPDGRRGARVYIVLQVSNGNPGLSLYDQAGQRRMLLGIVLRRPVLNLNDDSGRGRIQLNVGSNGAPMLDLIDAAGNPLIGMAIDPTAPNIGLIDAGSKLALPCRFFLEGRRACISPTPEERLYGAFRKRNGEATEPRGAVDEPG